MLDKYEATIVQGRGDLRLPIGHFMVNVKTGLNKPVPQVRKGLEAVPTYDRTSKRSYTTHQPRCRLFRR